MFCNLDELMTSLLCFLHYIVSSASSVDLSRRDFRTMMYYDYYQGKSFQECFQSLKHCFGDQSPSKATVFRWFRQFVLERES